MGHDAVSGYYGPATVVETELGRERLCRGCRELWPIDTDFWYFNARGKVMGHCRACWSERRRATPRRRAA